MKVLFLAVVALLATNAFAITRETDSLRAKYIGGHEEKIHDDNVGNVDPIYKHRIVGKVHRNVPTVHRSHETEYLGGVVDVQKGTTHVKKPAKHNMSTLVPPAAQAAKPVQPVPNPNPAKNSQVQSNNVTKPTQSMGGWGGTISSWKGRVQKFGGVNSTAVPKGSANATLPPKNTTFKIVPGPVVQPPPVKHTPVPTASSKPKNGSVIVAPAPPVIISGKKNVTITGAKNTTGNVTLRHGEITLNTKHKSVEYGGKADYALVDIAGKCAVWGNPASWQTFDQKVFTFSGLGEFIAYASENNYEQVNVLQQRVGRVSHTTGVAFRTGNNRISIALETTKAISPRTAVAVRFNGKKIVVGASRASVGNFSVLQEGNLGKAHKLMIALKNDLDTKVAAAIYSRRGYYHMDVFIQIKGSQWGHTKGLCGKFNFDQTDDFETADRQVVTAVETFAMSWSVKHPNDSQFVAKKPQISDIPVVKGQLSAFKASQSEIDYTNARFSCREVAAHYKETCELNVLAGGRKARGEIADVIDILSNGAITLSSGVSKCAKRHFRLLPWTELSKCSSACKPGVQTRTRHVYVGEHDCGQIKQSIICRPHCKKPNIWSKCGLWGLGHQVTFDGNSYDYQGSGEYTAYYSPTSKEQVNILRTRPNPAKRGAYTTGVAIRFGADVFAAQLQAPALDKLIISFNGNKVDPGTEAVYNFLTVKSTGAFGKSRYIVEVKLFGGTTVTLDFTKVAGVNHINTFIEVHGTKIGETLGLCGTYNFNQLDDFKNAVGAIDASGSKAAWSWRVSPAYTYFTAALPKAQQGLLVAPTYDDLNATASQVSSAKSKCSSISHKFRDQCIFDILFMSNNAALIDAKDVNTVINENVYSADIAGSQCLKEAGTELGPASKWTTTCSKKCGGGVFSKTQDIVNYNRTKCGVLTITKACNTQPCPINCTTSAWTKWTNCSNSCGDGTQTRTRTIVHKNQFGGEACPATSDSRKCHETVGCCNVGKWTNWGICREGKHERTRYVNYPRCGHNRETRPCCEMSRWSDWSDCVNGKTTHTRFLQGDNATCAYFKSAETKPCCSVLGFSDWSVCQNGKQFRTRLLQGDAHICKHWPKNETRSCCDVGPWSGWDSCVEGKQARYRRVVGDAGQCINTKKVDHRPCCAIGPWRPWSTCVNGNQTRSRSLTGDVTECSKVDRMQTHACCIVGTFTDWGVCSNGRRNRTRAVSGDPRVCSLHEAAQFEPCCEVRQWSDWTPCTNGTHSRRRTLVGAKSLCKGFKSTETEACCARGPWTSWSPCLGGFKTRTRSLSGDSEVCKVYASKQQVPCCQVGPWSDWSACKNGTVRRTRLVKGSLCEGFKAIESKPCCHVYDWTAWSSTCVGGYYTRTRKLSGSPEFCKQWHRLEKKPCCLIGHWGDWSQCVEGKQARKRNVTGLESFCGGHDKVEVRTCCKIGTWSGWSICESGKQHRVRQVTGDEEACRLYPMQEFQPCCRVGPWSVWSACVNERQYRIRNVEGHDGCSTEFNKKEYRTCGVSSCKPDKWSPWSACWSGKQKRTRTVHGGNDCPNVYPLVETRNCTDAFVAEKSLGGCLLGKWSDWSQCAGGKRTRHRIVKGTCNIKVDTQETLNCAKCQLSHWGNWSKCDITGFRSRVRNITGDCPAELNIERQECCYIGPWTAFSACSGNGLKIRVREVSNVPRCTNRYHPREVQNCCQQLGPWGEWGKCDSTGHQQRTRTFSPHSPHCAVLGVQKRECCQVNEWSEWSKCNKETHLRSRHRYVTKLPRCLSAYPDKEVLSCCNVTAWGPWSKCNGQGFQHRTRSVPANPICMKYHASSQNQTCCHVGAWSDYGKCNEDGWKTRTREVTNIKRCTDAHVSEEKADCCVPTKWSIWGACRDGGKQTRTRTVFPAPRCLAKHQIKEERDCCVAGMWGEWSKCSEDGKLTRTRTVHGNDECKKHKPSKETKSCCEVGEWQEWSECAESGSQFRVRKVNGDYDCKMKNKPLEQRPCKYVAPAKPATPTPAPSTTPTKKPVPTHPASTTPSKTPTTPAKTEPAAPAAKKIIEPKMLITPQHDLPAFRESLPEDESRYNPEEDADRDEEDEEEDQDEDEDEDEE